MRQVGIYTRLSYARDPAEQTATARQEADCRAFCSTRDLDPTAVYTDVDVSAYRKVHRPGFEDALRDIRSGRIDGLVFWRLDRLVRNHADFERLWTVCEDRGAMLASAMEPLDTTSELGMVVVRLLVSFARLESATISTRTQRANAELAKQGRPHVSGQRAFGLTRDWSDVVPRERDAILDAAERLLAGESLNAIAREWNAAGLTTSAGKQWRGSTLSRMIRGPHLAGKRVHKGEVVGDGDWPAILDEVTHRRLVARLTDPDRRGNRGGGPARYLLSGGLLRCGLCGARMASRPREDGVRRYVCRNQPGVEGCGGVGIVAEPLEGFVVERVLGGFTSDQLSDALRRQAGDDREAALLVSRLREAQDSLSELAADFYTHRLISRQEFLSARESLEGTIAECRRALSRTERSSLLAGLPSSVEALRAEWDARGVEWRRALLGAVVDRITVGRARRGLPFFDPGRVEIVWRV